MRPRSRPAARSAAGRLLTVGLGDAATLDRETVVRVGRVGRAPPRRPDGPAPRDLARPAGRRAGGDAAAAAELVARGVVEGSYDPRTIYRDEVETVPPVLDELILVAPGRRRREPGHGRRARAHHRRGREHRPDAVEPRLERRQPGGPRRRGAGDRRAARPVDRRHRARAGDRDGDGHVHGRRPGQRQPAADDRHALGRGRGARRARPPPRASSARASASTRAASASSRPPAWKR